MYKGCIMTEEFYTVEGRQFRTESDYARAKRDKELMDRLKARTDFKDKRELEKLHEDLTGGKYRFLTILGQDFLEEVEEQLQNAGAVSKGKNGKAKKASPAGQGRAGEQPPKRKDSELLDSYVQEELKRREKRRKIALAACSVIAAGCLGYFGLYSYFEYRTQNTYRQLSELKDKYAANPSPSAAAAPEGPLYTLDDSPEEREVLEEYKNLLNINKRLIGWLKFDDKNIDGGFGYPVMQTTDNEYYLSHNLNQEEDKNGSIFMDKDCNVLTPSTNYIIYGHNMQSGKMFGKLDLYQKESYCKEHPYIQFDTIYEKGTYQVMYVFRSRVYSEEEIVFKYYQFIDANSEQEFDSYMSEMAALSLYDTGVTAQYGDQLLTLSTCDYQEKNGRFVVVAKRIAKE